jgi:Rad3-related DNA helicase
MKSRLAVLNTSYWLSAITYVNLFTTPSLLIIDEADVFEQTVADFNTVTLSSSLRTKLDIPLPEKVTVADAWRPWIEDVVKPKLMQYLGTLDRENDKKEILRIVRLIDNLDWALGDYGIDEQHWVLSGYEKTRGKNKSNRKETIELKPVWLFDIMKDTVFPLPDRILMMSASFVSVSFYAKLLGLEKHEWAVVTVESPFDPLNRPIIFQPTTRMIRKNQDNWPSAYARIRDIVEHHQHERVLVHTHSYTLTRELHMFLKRRTARRIYTYQNAGERNRSLEAWLNSPDGVMLAPSFDRGIDLKGELCRTQIIAKVPYPYLGDQVVNARRRTKTMKGIKNAGQMWYDIETLKSMVQQCGRVVRSEKDWGVTYIVDAAFNSVLETARKVGPKWWLDAVIKPGMNYSKVEQHLGIEIAK